LTGFYDHHNEYKFIWYLAVECTAYMLCCSITKTAKISDNFNYEYNVYAMLNITKNMIEILSCSIEIELSATKIIVEGK
jgi:hypothetical protein